METSEPESLASTEVGNDRECWGDCFQGEERPERELGAEAPAADGPTNPGPAADAALSIAALGPGPG